MFFYWFIIKPSSGISPSVIVQPLVPTALSIEELSNGSYSYLFSSNSSPNAIQPWKNSFPWLHFSWINEGMFYPANLGYTQTFHGLNRFVSTYCLSVAHKELSPL